MHAETIDYGPYTGFLRQFGPPEVIALDDFAGNANTSEKASGFWECVEAVTLTLATGAAVATRRPRLRWFAGEATPFCQAQATVGATATHTVSFTFARDVNGAGAANDPAIIIPIPVLTMLPGWSVELDVPAGDAGDTVSDVRIYRRRFRVIELEPQE